MSTKDDQRDTRTQMWSPELARAPDSSWERAQEVGQGRRNRLRALESQLAQRLQALSEQLAKAQAVAQEQAKVHEARALAQNEQAAELAMRQDELTQELLRIAQERHELERREEAFAQAEKKPALAAAEPSGEVLAQIEELQEERTRLRERLAQAERKLEERPAASGGGSAEVEDLQRRFEMAVQDVRDLKTQNADLKRELEAVRSGSAAGHSHSVSGSDWESQKKRLMQQLEDDFSGTDGQTAADKLTVEGAIRITDQMVTEKEREIAELKRLLDDQSSNIGGLAVGASAVAAALDQDELIREERENLKRIQDEWRLKVRQAEVDISLERAKLARERAELDEKLQTLAASAKDDGADPSDKSKKPRRWLSMLMKESEGGK